MALSLRCGVIFGFFIETEKTYVESGKLYKNFDMHSMAHQLTSF